MKNRVFSLLLTMCCIINACKKSDDNDPNRGEEEGKKIEAAVIGKKYKITSVKDQQGANATSYFPTCIMDDTYKFVKQGILEITQSNEQCGKHTQAVINGSWGIGYLDNTVSAFTFSLFLNGNEYYQPVIFNKGMFNVNLQTGEIALMIKVDVNTYTIMLKQTL